MIIGDNMRQHYMNLPLTNRTNCIAFLKYMTTYTLTPESPEQTASRMTMTELQEYCKEKINTAKDKINNKKLAIANNKRSSLGYPKIRSLIDAKMIIEEYVQNEDFSALGVCACLQNE